MLSLSQKSLKYLMHNFKVWLPVLELGKIGWESLVIKLSSRSKLFKFSKLFKNSFIWSDLIHNVTIECYYSISLKRIRKLFNWFSNSKIFVLSLKAESYLRWLYLDHKIWNILKWLSNDTTSSKTTAITYIALFFTYFSLGRQFIYFKI